MGCSYDLKVDYYYYYYSIMSQSLLFFFKKFFCFILLLLHSNFYPFTVTCKAVENIYKIRLLLLLLTF